MKRYKLLIIPILAILIIEVVLRIFPSFDIAGISADVKENSQGFRDYEFSLDKPKDTFRILAIGDSFTFGLGVKSSQTYPKILESILNSKEQKKYEVFNMGLPAIGTIQEFEIIKDAVKYSPDLIMIGALIEDRIIPHDGNDLFDNMIMISKGKNSKNNYFQKDNFKKRSNLILFLYKIKPFLVAHSRLYYWFLKFKGNMIRKKLIRLRQYENEGKLKEAWDITSSIFYQIHDYTQRRNIKLVVLRIPFIHDFVLASEDRISDKFLEFSKLKSAYFHDLLPVFLSHKDRVDDYYIPEDGHWTAKAHKLAAEEIYRYLKDKNFLWD